MIGGIKTDAGKNREILICNKLVPVIQGLIESTTDCISESLMSWILSQYNASHFL